MPAFDAIVAGRPSAWMTLPDGMLLAHAPRIVEFAARARIPAVFPDHEFATRRGLMTYGPSLATNFRQAATYVGEDPERSQSRRSPIEQPTKFDLVINLKTAKALGLTIPLAAGAGGSGHRVSNPRLIAGLRKDSRHLG